MTHNGNLAIEFAANTMLGVMKFCFLNSFLALALLSGCARHHKDASPDAAAAVGSRNPYTTPLSTPGARFGILPAAVQNTVRSEAGTAEIVDARKERANDRVFYKVSFRDSANFPPLFIGADGSVLNPDLTVAVPAPQEMSQDVKLSDMPSAVRKVLQERAPGAEIASSIQENWGNHTVFVITFKDEAQHPKLYIASDGSLLIQAR